MLQEEEIIGNYTEEISDFISIKEEERRGMVMLIEDIYVLKKYRRETLYLAVSLADRYLVHETVNGIEKPCLFKLAVICILMAAKLE